MPGIEHGTVCIFGAGGPVGAVIAGLLRQHYRLRLTDIIGVSEAIARGGDPLWPAWEEAPEPPHEWRMVDVTDYRQVFQALEGCDAAVNLVVNRSEPEPAFSLNVGGAFNIMKAAAERGLKRVVHTGVQARTQGYEGDLRYEFEVPADAPCRPGTPLYNHSKSLGYQVVNAFAEHRGLDVVTLLLSRLRPADRYDGRDDDVVQGFSVSWRDLARAYLCALRAPEMPHPNEMFNICAPLPMDKFRCEKARELLGWEAEDRFEDFYTRGARAEDLWGGV